MVECDGAADCTLIVLAMVECDEVPSCARAQHANQLVLTYTRGCPGCVSACVSARVHVVVGADADAECPGSSLDLLYCTGANNTCTPWSPWKRGAAGGMHRPANVTERCTVLSDACCVLVDVWYSTLAAADQIDRKYLDGAFGALGLYFMPHVTPHELLAWVIAMAVLCLGGTWCVRWWSRSTVREAAAEADGQGLAKAPRPYYAAVAASTPPLAHDVSPFEPTCSVLCGGFCVHVRARVFLRTRIVHCWDTECC